MKKHFTILSFFLSFSFIVSAQVTTINDSAPVGYWLKAGTYFLQLGHYEEAVIYFDSVLKILPSHRNARLRKAEAFFKMGNYNWSKHELDYLLEQNPDDSSALFKRSLVYYSLKEYQPALADIGHFIEQNPGNAYGWYYQGLYLKNQVALKPWTIGNKSAYKKAIKSLNKAIELSGGKYYEAFVVLGNIYKNINDQTAAMANYQKAISCDSTQGLPYMNIGDMRLAEKDTAAALLYFYKAIEMNPGDQYTITQVNRHFMQLGMYDKALPIFEEWIANDSTSLDGWIGKGAVYLQQKKFTEALASFEKAVYYHPGTSACYYYRGLAHIGLKNQKAGTEDLRLASKMGHASARNYLETDLRYSESWLPFFFDIMKRIKQ